MLAVLALALLVGGVGAYLFLPTATAVIAPDETTIGPIDAARSSATRAPTEPDPRPAGRARRDARPSPVEASQTFEVTGQARRGDERPPARVRFRNKDFTSTNTIPKGSIVSTAGGIRFRTDARSTVPRAELVGLQIFPTTATVKVDGGERRAGRQRRAEHDPRDPTRRGPCHARRGEPRRDERRASATSSRASSRQTSTAATKALDAQLAPGSRTSSPIPSLAADGTTVFPETAMLGDADVQPSTRRRSSGTRSTTFDLGASATGTVLAVDETAVEEVAEANIAPHVQAGYELVDGSSRSIRPPGVVENGVITFPVTITATPGAADRPGGDRGRDPRQGLAEAQAILDRYGQSQLDGLAGLGRDDPDARCPGRRDGRRAATSDGGPVRALLGIDLGERRIGVAMADGPEVGAPTPRDTPPRRGRSPADAAGAAGAHRAARDR